MTAINGHAFAYKPDDQVQINNAALIDDDDLSFDVENGEVWWFDFRGLITTESATPDIQMALNGPTFSYLRFSIHIGDHAGAAGDEDIKTAWNDALAINYVQPAEDDFYIYGSVWPTADGTVVLRWAQRISDADDTIVKQGSRLFARRLA